MKKEDIIINCNKDEFYNYLLNDITGDILNLFDEEGIELLKKCPNKEERINYILVYSNYKNELLQNDLFLDVFLKSDISRYYANLRRLDDKTYDTIIKKCIDSHIDSDSLTKLITYFNDDYVSKVIDNKLLSEDLIYSIFKAVNFENKLRIIHNYNIDLTMHNIDIADFFDKAKKYAMDLQHKRNLGVETDELTMPVSLINKEVAEKMWQNYNIYYLREIINNASYFTNVDLLNDYVKGQEEIIINSDSNNFIFPYNVLYDCYKNIYVASEKNDIKAYHESRNILNRIARECLDRKTYNKIEKLFDEQGIEGLENLLKKLSNNMLSNYIFDYHFEENFYNVNIDLQELFNFYARGYIDLPEEKRIFYEDLIRFDDLSTEEKISYHQKMKEMKPSIKEVFYDDMALARKIVGEAIKDSALTKEELSQYLDEEKSAEFGVDVYVLDGEEFFAIVKTGTHTEDSLPTGHSYSLIGHDGLAVYGNVKNSDTYFYDASELNPEQFVHVFPYDSYTYYHPLEISSTASRKIHKLIMPEELTRFSKSYNELLILEKGKIPTDFDTKIPRLKKMALYCLDEIRKQDVIAAKANGVGIILVNSKKYEKDNNLPISSCIRNNTDFDNNYIDGINSSDYEHIQRL